MLMFNLLNSCVLYTFFMIIFFLFFNILFRFTTKYFEKKSGMNNTRRTKLSKQESLKCEKKNIQNKNDNDKEHF